MHATYTTRVPLINPSDVATPIDNVQRPHLVILGEPDDLHVVDDLADADCAIFALSDEVNGTVVGIK